MFLKQTAYKPRSGSQSSSSDAKEAPKSPEPRKSTDVQPGSITAAAAGRRRSSAAGAQYAGLHQYKRTSQDASGTERKQAYGEQKAGGGLLGGLWNNFTKGS